MAVSAGRRAAPVRMTTATAERLHPGDPAYKGQADYTPAFLAVYDPLVLGVMNRSVWRCRTSEILRLYESHAAGAHLDVGPGTGYYLDRCRCPEPPRSITLLDVNPDVLETASRRLARFAPSVHRANLLEPIGLDGATFDSIALTHVLHCLPGPMSAKSVVFDNLAGLLRPGGCLFGSTILAGGVPHTPVSRTLMRFLNRRGVFGNRDDDLATLEDALATRFAEHEVRTVGSVALFVARA
jgi:2-polyprenyl-3-methyl-5-hydroxy-6-metoxy-1,4-benzoquinol methylase